MPDSWYLYLIVLIAAIAAGVARERALSCKRLQPDVRLHSLPHYHAVYAALMVVIPALVVLVLWRMVEPGIVLSIIVGEYAPLALKEDASLLQLRWEQMLTIIRLGEDVFNSAQWLRDAANAYVALSNQADWWQMLAVGLAGLGGGVCAVVRVAAPFPARSRVERVMKGVLIVSSLAAVLVTLAIILSVLFESVRFFQIIPLHEFIFGMQWSPQMAMREDQVGASGAFGAIPLFWGTIFITLIAMCVAAPVGLMAAIYLSEYASLHVRRWAKPVLEVLAGVPTVVYGYFAAITVAPYIRDMGVVMGMDVALESALAAGLVMGVMIIPFVSSLSDDVINAVPQALRDASLGLGSTKSETIKKVVLPAATPGIVGAMLLAVSRAVGETMIVVMAAGLHANMTINPLESVTTVTVQIVKLLVGDQEFDSAKTLAAFALGLALFIFTLALNMVALRIVKQYRRRYA